MKLSLSILPLMLILSTSSLFAQELHEKENYFLLDYWPVLLLPIFGILWFTWWRKRKKNQKQD